MFRWLTSNTDDDGLTQGHGCGAGRAPGDRVALAPVDHGRTFVIDESESDRFLPRTADGTQSDTRVRQRVGLGCARRHREAVVCGGDRVRPRGPGTGRHSVGLPLLTVLMCRGRSLPGRQTCSPSPIP